MGPLSFPFFCFLFISFHSFSYLIISFLLNSFRKVKRNETCLEHAVLHQHDIVAELKITMAHTRAEHMVCLKDFKKLVRDSSLEKMEVEKVRVECEIEMKKEKRKAAVLVHTVMERDKSITNMKRTLEDSSALQVSSLHDMKRIVRQHTVDKDDALEHAHNAKSQLAAVVKKADRRIDKLKSSVKELVQDKLDMAADVEERIDALRDKLEQDKLNMAAHVEERVESLDLQQRAMSKANRDLQIQHADLEKQQGILEIHASSLAHQRISIRTERKKLKTTHSKAIEELKTTHSKVSFLFFFCIVLSLLLVDSLIVLLF
jgi:hypothetical protein